MSQTLSSFLVPVILALGVPLMAALTWAGVKLALWLHAKVKNENAASILTRLDSHVFVAVQSLVSKALADVQAGGLTSATLANIKTDAIAMVKGFWGAAGLAQIEQVLGMAPDQVTSLIAAKVSATAPPPASPNAT